MKLFKHNLDGSKEPINFTATNTIVDYWKTGGPNLHILEPKSSIRHVLVNNAVFNTVSNMTLDGASILFFAVVVKDKDGNEQRCNCGQNVWLLKQVQTEDLVNYTSSFDCRCPGCSNDSRFLPVFKFEFVKVICDGKK